MFVCRKKEYIKRHVAVKIHQKERTKIKERDKKLLIFELD